MFKFKKMKRLFSPKKILSLLRNNYYVYCYKKLPIIDKYVVLESQHGRNVNGNIFYIMKELMVNTKYKELKIFVTVTKDSKKKIKILLNKYGFENVELVQINTKKYLRLCATAKYLINNNTFLPFFIKKDGQVYLNTWHGTPLKTLGRQIKNESHKIGNTQRNFLMSDYLLYPNEHTKNSMLKDYMIEHLFENNTLLSGYPRNEIFFDKNAFQIVRNKFKLEDKEVIAYMPTWRGTLQDSNNQSYILDAQNHLRELDHNLKDSQVCYVNLHPIVSDQVDYNKFEKIRPFPQNIETYEFLNACDCLITDYSSVFFDYANSGKKIILFAYDEEEYIKTRGMYIELSELPFPIVKNVQTLIREINSPKNYEDTQFLKTYCSYDNINSSKTLCEKIFNQDSLEKNTVKKPSKESVLIYGGNLSKNGITSSLFNLLSNLDLEDRDYYLLVNQMNVGNHIKKIADLPSNIKFYSFRFNINATLKERIIHKVYFNFKIVNEYILKIIDQIYKREYRRVFFKLQFDYVIHFSGYESKLIHLLSIDQDAKKIIYVHSDMEQEIISRGNQNKKVLKYAYNNYDKVAVVTKDILDSTARIKGGYENIHITNNLIDYTHIKQQSLKKIKLDESTEMNKNYDQLMKILRNSNKKFITIGRFSIEKGHDRLIKSFNELYKFNKNLNLIIIGGHGKLHKKTIRLVESLECRDNIVIIKSISNPFSILKECDYFVLSSLYEGFGLVLAEAAVLGIPVISTDIDGPRLFMKEHNGYLVDNSYEGILQGMKDCLDGKVKPLEVDFAKYNKKAIVDFNKLMK